MVMGSWCSCTRGRLVRIRHQRNLFLHFLIALLLLSSGGVSARRRHRQCQVDRCSEDYRSISDTTDDTKKCRLLLSHRNCLTHMRDRCRGNLLYHTSININKQKMKMFHCSNLLQNLSNRTLLLEPSVETNCSYASGKPNYKFCSLFGDPHVRTFNDKFYTCTANGSWPLINNDYLEVTATNTLLDEGMGATAISKLSVSIKGSGECAQQKNYIADITTPLAATFTDGSSHSGLEKSVKITEIVPGTEIEIHIRFISTTLVIRQMFRYPLGNHLNFAVQMPEEIVDSPIDERAQMCVKGCPRQQRIKLSKEIDRLSDASENSVQNDEMRMTEKSKPSKDKLRVRIPKFSEEEARKRCQRALLEEDSFVSRRRRRSAEEKLLSESQKTTTNRRSVSHRRNRNAELDPASTTWQLLSGSSDSSLGEMSSSLQAPSSDKTQRRKQKRRSSSQKRRRKKTRMMADEGRPNRGRNSVRGLKRGANFYFEACVFDLMTTGDVMYASSARGAWNDVTRFHESGSNARATSLDPVNEWKPAPTVKPLTEIPKSVEMSSENTFTARHKPIETKSPPGNGVSSKSSQLNLTVFLSCLLASCSLVNLVNLYNFLELMNNKFFNIAITTRIT